MADKKLSTDYNALFTFAKDLDRFCDYLSDDIEELKRETDYITGYSWKGRQAEDFSIVVSDNSESIKKNIAELRDLVDKIKNSAEKLRIASSRKIG